MKTLKQLTAIVLLVVLSLSVNAQNYENEKLYLPGDNLNLYAVMNLFQESETLEGFERNLNAADSKVNNLDLNGDNLIDYIKVIDYVDGTTHTIVLQVAINNRENQDVAVFTVYRDKYDQVQVQLVGDEYLYGKDYIIEPYYAETPNPGYTGNTGKTNNKIVVKETRYVYVNSWPVVRYIYTPSYVAWYSPWYWNYYPVYWNPWRPYYWDYYYGYHSHWHNHYYSRYRYSNHYYNHYYADNYYHGHRSYSTTVRNYRDDGRYKSTYSRPDLRSKGSDEGKRVYASAVRNSGRADGQNPGRGNGDVNQRKAAVRNTPSAGRTLAPGNGRSATDIRSDRKETPRRSVSPVVDRKSGRTKATPQVGKSTKPVVSSTARNQRKKVDAPRREVKRQKTQAPSRSSNKPAVRSSNNRSSRVGQAVKSSTSRASQPANRNSSTPKKSSSSRRSNGSGR